MGHMLFNLIVVNPECALFLADEYAIVRPVPEGSHPWI